MPFFKIKDVKPNKVLMKARLIITRLIIIPSFQSNPVSYSFTQPGQAGIFSLDVLEFTETISMI